MLLKHTEINEHALKLKNGKQPPYEPIYSLDPEELKTLKTYIKTNLANDFIQPLKSPASAPILFIDKLNSSFRLCINYQGPNNLTIKNRYSLLLINESLNQLEQAKHFTQLDLTSGDFISDQSTVQLCGCPDRFQIHVGAILSTLLVPKPHLSNCLLIH